MLVQYKYGNIIALCLSAMLVFIAVLQINFVLAPFCLVPLFLVLQKGSMQSIKAGVVFGAVLSVLSFSWMIPGAQRFTGSGMLYGIVVFVISALVLILYWVILFVLFTCLQRPLKKHSDVYWNAVLAGCLWVLSEAALAFIAAQLPWFLFRTGMAVSGNLYAIQPVSFLGVSIATFFIIAVNYLIAYFISHKQYKRLWIAFLIVAVYVSSGFVMLTTFQQQKSNLRPVKAAMLTENIPAAMRWDENNGNMLVERLLGLARAAVPLQPDIAIWSESTVPWTYRADDDFVNEIIRITKSQNITHIIGINSDADAAKVYNSVYGIQPDGKVFGRYDKRYLLGFIEQPVAGIIFPFLSSGGYVVMPGKSSAPLQTPYGKAGILTCNESAVARAAASEVSNGAQFLLNMSNDGWFGNTYIAIQHFYNARLRAVETRKDIVVNSNDGISGLVKASGEIVNAQRSNDPNIDIAIIQPNNFKPLAVSFPYMMLYLSGIMILVNAFFAIKAKRVR